jgi:hypothetical protein
METLFYGDVLLRRRFIEETFCRGVVLYVRLFVNILIQGLRNTGVR